MSQTQSTLLVAVYRPSDARATVSADQSEEQQTTSVDEPASDARHWGRASSPVDRQPPDHGCRHKRCHPRSWRRLYLAPAVRAFQRRCRTTSGISSTATAHLQRHQARSVPAIHLIVPLLLVNRNLLCGGYNDDSTSIRRPFDCLSKVIEVTVT